MEPEVQTREGKKRAKSAAGQAASDEPLLQAGLLTEPRPVDRRSPFSGIRRRGLRGREECGVRRPTHNRGAVLRRIVSAFAEGVAAADSPRSAKRAAPGAVLLYGSDEVMAARGLETALTAKDGAGA